MSLRISTIDRNTKLPADADMLDARGQLRLRPAAAFDAISRDSLRLWCHKYARYTLVTEELVAWLRRVIDTRRAIEIGAGAGDLAYHLGIPATDSRMQEAAAIRAYYAALGQPVIRYPDFVEKAEAQQAIRQHRPDLVIGCWITHWIDPTRPPPPGGGSVVGVHEDEIVRAGLPYVLIGNRATHAAKPIRALPHREMQPPWLRSRAQDQLDRIWIWNGDRLDL